MQDDATASVTAATLYSEAGGNDSASAFLSRQDATYRQTILSQHHHKQLFSQDNLVSYNQPGHLNAQLQDASRTASNHSPTSPMSCSGSPPGAPGATN